MYRNSYGDEINRKVVLDNIEYINSVLFPDKPIKNVAAIDSIAYKAIYTAAKQHYKDEQGKFEEEILALVD